MVHRLSNKSGKVQKRDPLWSGGSRFFFPTKRNEQKNLHPLPSRTPREMDPLSMSAGTIGAVAATEKCLTVACALIFKWDSIRSCEKQMVAAQRLLQHVDQLLQCCGQDAFSHSLLALRDELEKKLKSKTYNRVFSGSVKDTLVTLQTTLTRAIDLEAHSTTSEIYHHVKRLDDTTHLIRRFNLADEQRTGKEVRIALLKHECASLEEQLSLVQQLLCDAQRESEAASRQVAESQRQARVDARELADLKHIMERADIESSSYSREARAAARNFTRLEQQLEQRERVVREREQTIKTREQMVGERERTLCERECVVCEREEAVSQRELMANSPLDRELASACDPDEIADEIADSPLSTRGGNAFAALLPPPPMHPLPCSAGTTRQSWSPLVEANTEITQHVRRGRGHKSR